MNHFLGFEQGNMESEQVALLHLEQDDHDLNDISLLEYFLEIEHANVLTKYHNTYFSKMQKMYV